MHAKAIWSITIIGVVVLCSDTKLVPPNDPSSPTRHRLSPRPLGKGSYSFSSYSSSTEEMEKDKNKKEKERGDRKGIIIIPVSPRRFPLLSPRRVTSSSIASESDASRSRHKSGSKSDSTLELDSILSSLEKKRSKISDRQKKPIELSRTSTDTSLTDGDSSRIDDTIVVSSMEEDDPPFLKMYSRKFRDERSKSAFEFLSSISTMTTGEDSRTRSLSTPMSGSKPSLETNRITGDNVKKDKEELEKVTEKLKIKEKEVLPTPPPSPLISFPLGKNPLKKQSSLPTSPQQHAINSSNGNNSQGHLTIPLIAITDTRLRSKSAPPSSNRIAIPLEQRKRAGSDPEKYIQSRK